MRRTVLFLNLVLVAIVYSIFPVEHFESPKTAVLITIALVAFVMWINSLFQTDKPAQTFFKNLKSALQDPIGLGFLVFSVSALVSTITSISPRISFWGTPESGAGLSVIFAYVVLYFATKAWFKDPRDAQKLATACLFTSTVSCAYAFLQSASYDPVSWSRVLTPYGVLRPLGTLGHPNFFSAYLTMSIPILANLSYTAFGQKRWGLVLGTIALGGAYFVAIILTQSRGSWLALAAVTCVLAIGLFGLGKLKYAKRVLVVIASVAVMLVAIAKMPQNKFPEQSRSEAFVFSIQDRIQNITELGSARAEYWRTGLKIFKQYPLFGSGLDTFQLAFQHLRPANYWLEEWAGTPHKAHNEIINTMATQGIFGLLALMILTAGILFTARNKWTNAGQSQKRFILALFAGIVGFYVQGISSFTVSTTGSLFVTFCALLSISNEEPEVSSEHALNINWYYHGLLGGVLLTCAIFFHNFLPIDGSSQWQLALLIALAVLTATLVFFAELRLEKFELPLKAIRNGVVVSASALAITLVWLKVIAIPLSGSLVAKSASDLATASPEIALALYERAVSYDRGSDRLVMNVGYTASDISAKSTDRKTKVDHLRLAIRAFEHAVKLVPEDAGYHYSLGQVLVTYTLDDIAQHNLTNSALDELSTAVRLEPNNPIYLSGAINASVLLGDLSRARPLIEREVALYPNHAIGHYHKGHLLTLMKDYLGASSELRIALNSRRFPSTRTETNFDESLREQTIKELNFAIERVSGVKKAAD